MLNITTSNDIPNSTYFTASDVEPILSENTLTIFQGKGDRRSWGAPQVTSTIVVNDDQLTAVHVGFSHKHRGGQGWYYYVAGQRKTWAQLPDSLRSLVLENEKKAPGWAKTPGTLKVAKAKPAPKLAYKLVRFEGDKLVSLFDGETEYQLGKRLSQKAQPDHSGGYYAYPTAEGCKALWAAGKLINPDRVQGVTRLALLEVEISGKTVSYGSKIAATYLKPVRVIEVIEVR